MPKESKKGGKQLLYIEASTLEDIVRFATRFDSSAKELITAKFGKKHRIIALAEGIDDVVIALYKDIDVDADTIRYEYTSGASRAQFVSGVEQRQPGVAFVNLVEIEISKFREAKPSAVKGVDCVQVKGEGSLIKGLIKKSVIRETIEYAYAFPYKGKTIIGAFDLIEELSGERKTFYYSTSNSKAKADFARYNYTTDKLDFSDEFGEHSYMYVKIINLAKPFPFFKE
ncbi:MAG: hypothetical protein KGH78_01155 [Candidatus Micrarchaeota archaeon]|nr:hypothetical protein [Candidatus Micrarchaeota archaeon]